MSAGRLITATLTVSVRPASEEELERLKTAWREAIAKATLETLEHFDGTGGFAVEVSE